MAPKKATEPAPNQSRPAWYYRVLHLSFKRRNQATYRSDYDMDLSDLEEKEEQEEKPFKCNECMQDPDDDPEWDDCDHMDDDDGERSYQESDADCYYEMKEEREERKREMKEAKDAEAKERAAAREYEAKRVAEVKQAYARLPKAAGQKGAAQRLTLPTTETFKLFCIEHLDHCDAGHNHTKFVRFEVAGVRSDNGPVAPLTTEMAPEGAVRRHRDAVAITKTPRDVSPRMRQGIVRLHANVQHKLAQFKLPKWAGRRTHVVKSSDGNHALMVKFINSDYLIMTVPQTLACDGRAPSESAPETFRYMGIRQDLESKAAPVLRREDRSPSLGDTWFERTHPEGSWNCPP